MKFTDVFKENFLNVSNSLSVLRIILLPFFFYYSKLYAADPGNDRLMAIVVVLIVFAVLSDFLDGYLARRWHQETKMGRYLDPIADKTTSLVALIILLLYFEFPLWVFLLFLFREVGGVWMGTFLYFKRDMQGKPNIWGKLGVTLTALCVLWYALSPRLQLLFPEDHVVNMPWLAAYAYAVVMVIGIAAYWWTYWDVIFYGKADEEKEES